MFGIYASIFNKENVGIFYHSYYAAKHAREYLKKILCVNPDLPIENFRSNTFGIANMDEPRNILELQPTGIDISFKIAGSRNFIFYDNGIYDMMSFEMFKESHNVKQRT